MKKIKLTSGQLKLVGFSDKESVFLEGPAGSGKTTAALAKLEKILGNHPGYQTLILVPQRSLGLPYQQFLNEKVNLKGGLPLILTLGGLAKRMVELFWPLIAAESDFRDALKMPRFLTTETAQYCMEKVVSPFIEKGFFRSIVMEKNRLYSQILDNLNKSAVVGFSLNSLAVRLKNTSVSDPSLVIAYDQVQTCALEFRSYCLENNLLDYSLLIQLFIEKIWARKECRDSFYGSFRFLVADNVEEDVPVSHDLVKEWLPNLEGSLVILDQNGGYRQFLGADPFSAFSIAEICSRHILFEEQFGKSGHISRLSDVLSDCVNHQKSQTEIPAFKNELEILDFHFYPEMTREVAEKIHSLVSRVIADPESIVVLSPYLSDALNFSLESNLAKKGIPFRSSRPSAKYLSDPSVKAMIALAKLSHPHWGLPLSKMELRGAFMVVLPDIDIVRADLLVKTLYSEKNPQEGLRSFDSLTNQEIRDRISYHLGEKLEKLRTWLMDYSSKPSSPLDVFLSSLYGELLSQKQFALFNNFHAADIIARLIQSIRSFRQFSSIFLNIDEISSGFEYIRSLNNGLLPSAIFSMKEERGKGVLISPAHAFLMENRHVDIQFWLDIGSMGWWERLNQPLANPYLLNRNIDSSQKWSEAHEFNANQASMQRVVSGLLNRCNKKIFVCVVRMNEYGSEPRGPLLQAFQTLQKRIHLCTGGKNV